jgi:hypothetical protein
LSQALASSIETFIEPGNGFQRKVTLIPSTEPGTAYVFLQLGATPEYRNLSDWRDRRKWLLQVACGAAKLKEPSLLKVVGIGIEHPSYVQGSTGNDFALLLCDPFTPEERAYYERHNKELRFFATADLRAYETMYSLFARE